MYQPHSTEKWTAQRQREFDRQRRAQSQDKPAPPVPKRKRGIHPLIILGPAGFVLLCAALLIASSLLAPSESAVSDLHTQTPMITPETAENAVQERTAQIDQPIATTTPAHTPTATIDYQATVDALKSEQAHLEATQQQINDQIQYNQDLELQVTQQYLNGLIEIEKQRVDDHITEMQAASEAAANQAVANSIIEIANAESEAEIIAEKTKNEIENLEQEQERQKELNDTITIILQVVIALIGFFIICILCLGFGWFWNTGRKRHNLKLRDIGRQETAAMQGKPKKQAIKSNNGKTQNELARLLSNSIAYWNSQERNGRAETQIPSYDMVRFSGEDWTRLTDYLVNLHLVEKRQGRNGGTFFRYGNLHEWLMVCLNGNIESVDPLKTANSSPSESV